VIVVVDTNVVVSAAFWPRSEDRRCFVLLARRKWRLAVTEAILDEYRTLATRVGRRECPDKDPTPFLDWIDANGTDGSVILRTMIPRVTGPDGENRFRRHA